MKLGYPVKAELNNEVETCRKNTQKKHWNMIVGTYDEKQKISTLSVSILQKMLILLKSEMQQQKKK